MENTVGVLIVDDNSAYRSVAAAVVDATNGFETVGTAEDVEQALQILVENGRDPELVLMDINLGQGSGLDATRIVLKERPAARIILVSTLALEDLPTDAMACGATGYLPKSLFSPTTLEQLHRGLYDWAR